MFSSNPSVIVEVLSSSTERYDRDLKWESYRTLASVTDYLLVSQGAIRPISALESRGS